MNKPTTLDRFKNFLKAQLETCERKYIPTDSAKEDTSQLIYLFPHASIEFKIVNDTYFLNDILISPSIGKEIHIFIYQELHAHQQQKDEEKTLALLKTLMGEPSWKKE